MVMNVWGYDVGSNHYPMLAYTALLPLPHFSLPCTMRYKLLKLNSTSFSPPWMLCLTTAPEVIESSDSETYDSQLDFILIKLFSQVFYSING